MTTAHARGGTGSTAQAWPPEEASAMVTAVNRAPSVQNAQPWSLELRDRAAVLHERPDSRLLERDPSGREQQLALGAALTNLVLAVRKAGWSAEVHSHYGEHITTTVVASRPRAQTATDNQRYRAIVRRASYRRAFENQPLSHVTKESLYQATRLPGVFARWVTGDDEVAYLARVLAHTGRVERSDPGYRWELAAWTAQQERADRLSAAAFGGSPRSARSASRPLRTAADWTNEQRLAARIGGESLLVLSTPVQGRDGHLRVGQAMQQAWLEATSFGIVGSVLPQPLRLQEVRDGVAERLALPGAPLVFMRFGYPGISVPRDVRRPLGEICVAGKRQDP
ncbi:nitroreductase family protein [Parasphingorhabdus pacifica]